MSSSKTFFNRCAEGAGRQRAFAEVDWDLLVHKGPVAIRMSPCTMAHLLCEEKP